MSNTNVFIDVDVALPDHNERVVPIVRGELQKLADRGYRLFLVSQAGGKYAETIALRHGMECLFEGFLDKPDIIVDDMPGSMPILFNPNQEESWMAMVDRMIRQTVDWPTSREPDRVLQEPREGSHNGLMGFLRRCGIVG